MLVIQGQPKRLRQSTEILVPAIGAPTGAGAAAAPPDVPIGRAGIDATGCDPPWAWPGRDSGLTNPRSMRRCRRKGFVVKRLTCLEMSVRGPESILGTLDKSAPIL